MNLKNILLCNLVLVFTLFLNESECARILAIVPTPSYSHQVAFRLIWKELSLRGHQVTLLTTDPINDKTLTNLTEVNLSFSYDLWNGKHNITDLIEIAQEDKVGFIKKFKAMTSEIIKAQLSHPELQKLIKNEDKQHFDVVLAEFFHPTMYAFAELYNCPLIGIASLETLTIVYDSMGNPTHPVLQPDVSLPFGPPLNFKERVISTLYGVFLNGYVRYVVMPEETRTVRKYFGEHYPTMQELRNSMSLFFVNTDPIFSVIRPLVPSIIQVGGGSHLNSNITLPQHLQKILDDEIEGVIYFSLGTNVKSGNVRKETIKRMLEAFSEIPYKVLWKFDGENFSNKTQNVMVSKWLPQQAVLRHPNVKLFITQGGWQSIEESIYSHTPMLGLPFFGDQPTNVNKLVSRGIALSLDHKTMTKDSFKSAILELIENPVYRTRVKELAQLAQDQPMTGLEKAVWWTEYVIRHKGAEHLRSPAIDLPFYQYYLLDVIGFSVLVIAIVVRLAYYLLKIAFKIVNYVTFKTKIKTL